MRLVDLSYGGVTVVLTGHDLGLITACVQIAALDSPVYLDTPRHRLMADLVDLKEEWDKSIENMVVSEVNEE